MQYADIVTSSTGKSLHSADHGLVLYNDPTLTPKIREAVMPLLTSITHFHETAALCLTLLEMREFGAAYAAQVVANTRVDRWKVGFKAARVSPWTGGCMVFGILTRA